MKIDIDQMSIRELIEHFKMLGFFETERPEMERELDSEIKQLESDIKTLTDRRNKLTSQLESIKTGKVFDTTEAGNSIRRQGQTIQIIAKLSPDIKRGPTRNWPRSRYRQDKIKELRGKMIVIELEHRKAENPGIPVTSSKYPIKTLAYGLAVDLSDAGVKMCGYQTIRKIWAARGKN